MPLRIGSFWALGLVLALMALAVSADRPASAETTLTCPSLADAKPVGECLSEQQLRRQFRAVCGRERAPDAQNPDICDAYAEYKRQKNTTFWESSNGLFDGYLHCSLTPTDLASAKIRFVTLASRGKLSKVVCVYEGDRSLTYRHKGKCRIAGSDAKKADCPGNAKACTFTCD